MLEMKVKMRHTHEVLTWTMINVIAADVCKSGIYDLKVVCIPKVANIWTMSNTCKPGIIHLKVVCILKGADAWTRSGNCCK